MYALIFMTNCQTGLDIAMFGETYWERKYDSEATSVKKKQCNMLKSGWEDLYCPESSIDTMKEPGLPSTISQSTDPRSISLAVITYSH